MSGWNPYLDELRNEWDFEDVGMSSMNGFSMLRWDGDEYQGRFDLIHRYAFAIPDDRALDVIASYAPIVEIGAGNGYWARCLRERGVDVIAYDSFGEEYSRHFAGRHMWTDVLVGTHRDVRRHPDRTLLLVWPSLNERWAEHAVRTHRAHGGRHVIYVGEGHGGCTADDSFHRRLDRQYVDVGEVDIPVWFGIHDRLTVHRRMPDEIRREIERAPRKANGTEGEKFTWHSTRRL